MLLEKLGGNCEWKVGTHFVDKLGEKIGENLDGQISFKNQVAKLGGQIGLKIVWQNMVENWVEKFVGGNWVENQLEKWW